MKIQNLPEDFPRIFSTSMSNKTFNIQRIGKTERKDNSNGRHSFNSLAGFFTEIKE